MFQQMKKRIKNEKGLTLIELLAVIVILAIVAAIAIPAIGNIIDSSRVKAAKADAANILSAANIYFTENPSATNFSNTTTDVNSYISDKGTVKTFTVTKNITGNTIIASGESGGKTYNIASTTLANLKVDSGKEETPFSWGTGTPTSPPADGENNTP